MSKQTFFNTGFLACCGCQKHTRLGPNDSIEILVASLPSVRMVAGYNAFDRVPSTDIP